MSLGQISNKAFMDTRGLLLWHKGATTPSKFLNLFVYYYIIYIKFSNIFTVSPILFVYYILLCIYYLKVKSF